MPIRYRIIGGVAAAVIGLAGIAALHFSAPRPNWSFQVDLRARVGVGSRWILAPFDTTAVKLAGEPEFKFADPAIDGSAATQRWRFVATCPAAESARLVELRFEYRSFPGERRDTLLEVKTFTVMVPGSKAQESPSSNRAPCVYTP